MRPPSLRPDRVSPHHDAHCLSRPSLGRPTRAQDGRFLSLESRPGPSSTASTRECHQPPTSARRRRASRAAPLAALGRRLPLRPTPGPGAGGGAVIGVSRSTLTGSLSAAAAMVGVEPSSSAAAAAAAAGSGASRGGESGAAATGQRRAAAARRGATRPSSGLQLSMRWLRRRQRSPAYVRRPCRCNS